MLSAVGAALALPLAQLRVEDGGSVGVDLHEGGGLVSRGGRKGMARATEDAAKDAEPATEPDKDKEAGVALPSPAGLLLVLVLELGLAAADSFPSFLFFFFFFLLLLLPGGPFWGSWSGAMMPLVEVPAVPGAGFFAGREEGNSSSASTSQQGRISDHASARPHGRPCPCPCPCPC